jgi:GNAT superfamily N-acetyltransferase
VDSPITQTFGLGIFEELTERTLDQIEQFFRKRHAPVMHEVSPFAGVSALDILCARNYRPIELSSVMYRPVEGGASPLAPGVTVRVVGPGELERWTDVSTRGWAHEHPELTPFLRQLGQISAVRSGTVCFLAEHDGVPGAAGALSIFDSVALFAGAATVPELRRRGLQGALMQERMRYAREQGCDLAMMVALPGSDSQRNAERTGFRIAYTRTKWQLQEPKPE